MTECDDFAAAKRPVATAVRNTVLILFIVSVWGSEGGQGGIVRQTWCENVGTSVFFKAER